MLRDRPHQRNGGGRTRNRIYIYNAGKLIARSKNVPLDNLRGLPCRGVAVLATAVCPPREAWQRTSLKRGGQLEGGPPVSESPARFYARSVRQAFLIPVKNTTIITLGNIGPDLDFSCQVHR